MKAKHVFVGIGSNRGDRKAKIYYALQLMHASPSVNLINTSDLYETEPVGVSGHSDYLNLTAEIRTTLNPNQLLELLQSIEDRLGRENRGELTPRTIDLDILLYGNQIMESETLTVPHPRLTERKFVLLTLVELNPDLTHPITGKTIAEHLEECLDNSRCEKFSS